MNNINPVGNFLSKSGLRQSILKHIIPITAQNILTENVKEIIRSVVRTYKYQKAVIRFH